MKHPEAEASTLLNLADRVNDCTPVDWDAVARDTPELSGTLWRLKSLETIAAAYRDSSGPREGAVRAPAGAASVGGPPPPAPGEVLFNWGPLQAVEKLGEGSYGRVYRAFDPRLARYVALKLWSRPAEAAPMGAAPGSMEDDPTLRRLLDEARRLARLRHPNVLVVHGADAHDGQAGLWCDLLSGETLEARLRGGRRLSAPEAAFIGIELCRALAAIHAAGLVHGDLKASNVMRDDGGAIVLLDFGSSRSGSAALVATHSTGQPTDPDSGTPLIMSPERLRGEPGGPAGDLYALGVLLYRLVSGHYPVEAADREELLARLTGGGRTPLRDRRPDLPAGFVQAVERALALAPADRQAGPAGLEADLWASLRGADAPTPATPGESGGGVARPRWPGAVLLFAAVVALTFGVVNLAQRRNPSGARPQLPAGLEIEASLFRAGPEGVARLDNGSRVMPGDRLYLDLVSNEPLHAYVIDEDDKGELYVLFPVRGLEPTNPLPASTLHRLPGRLSGVAQDWRVTSAGGRETILIVTSRRPLPLLEARLDAMPIVQPGQAPTYADLDPLALSELRGIAGLVPADTLTIQRPGSRLTDLVASLTGVRPTTSGIWLRTVTLENP